MNAENLTTFATLASKAFAIFASESFAALAWYNVSHGVTETRRPTETLRASVAPCESIPQEALRPLRLCAVQRLTRSDGDTETD